MFEFAEATKDMTAKEILNYYRNLYYAEPQVTERGIMANAINGVLADVVPKSEVDDLIYKLECLLCHATGGRLSKHTYELRTMETVVTDCINETYNDGYGEGYKDCAREIFKEIAETCVPETPEECGRETQNGYLMGVNAFLENILKFKQKYTKNL